MDLADIKRQLARPATAFTVGGFRPTGSDDESWIGKVFLYRPGESVLIDEAGEEMLPLAQLHLDGLPHRSPLLAGTRVLTLFISRTLPEPLEPDKNWLVREYGHAEKLERGYMAHGSFLKPFPLKPTVVEADFPQWDSGELPLEIDDELLRLQKAGAIESYDDIAPHDYRHTVRGYPSYCQSGVYVGSGFELVLQIASDPKVDLNVVDEGRLMFWKNGQTGEWALTMIL